MGFPSQRCSVLPTSTVHSLSQQPSDTGRSIIHLVQVGKRGRQRTFPLFSWEKVSAQHLQAFAQKFCCQKENLPLDFASILEMTGFIKTKKEKALMCTRE